MDKPYTVLGTYIPEVYDAERIGRELGLLVSSHGLKKHPGALSGVTVRGPKHNKALSDSISSSGPNKFHRDANQVTTGDLSLVVWASDSPTELLSRDGTVWQPAPFEVVLFSNSEVMHRIPPNIGSDRWFFREFVLTPK